MNQVVLQHAPMTAACLIERLRERMEHYDGLNAVGRELKLIKEVPRRFCKLYLFRLSSHSGRPDLVVKVPMGQTRMASQGKDRNRSLPDRPRLFAQADPNTKPRKEYAALRRIQMHFGAQHDPRFGVVPVYDLLPEHQAVVMQWIDLPSLRERLYATHRFGNARQARRLEKAFSHAGAWLRRHHELPQLADSETRNALRDDYLEAIERYVAYLVDRVGNRDELKRMHQRIVALASDHLPTTVSTGQVHCDFAPRNVFIDHEDRVTVIDTLGRFEAPIYEDIALMLMSINASGPQMFSRGLFYDPKRLHRYEHSFLTGYFFDQPVPFPAIRLFLVQLLLDHWAAAVSRHEHQRGIKRVVQGGRLAVRQSAFQAYLRETITTLSSMQSFPETGATP
jgi:hypothetical protein